MPARPRSLPLVVALAALVALTVAALAASAGPAAAQRDNGADVFSLAGSSEAGWRDGYGTQALFQQPHGIATDLDGDIIVADTYNHRIRKVTPDGHVTTIAGSGQGNRRDATGSDAQFNQPTGVTVDPEDDSIYVADFLNGLIRHITDGNRVGTITRGGEFWAGPRDVAVDTRGNIYVAEANAGWVRRLTPDNRREVVVDGLTEPWSVAVDPRGNLFVTDYGKQRILRVTRSGRVHTYAGTGEYGARDGGPGVATFGRPSGIEIDSLGRLYVTDLGTRRIRRVERDGSVRTIAGCCFEPGFGDGDALLSRWDSPIGVVPARDNSLYAADRGNHRIRKVSGLPPTLPRRLRIAYGRLRSRGLATRCGSNDPARCRYELRLGRRTVGRGSARLSSPGRTSLRVRLTRSGRRALAAATRDGSATLSLRRRVLDRGGNRGLSSLRVLVRR